MGLFRGMHPQERWGPRNMKGEDAEAPGFRGWRPRPPDGADEPAGYRAGRSPRHVDRPFPVSLLFGNGSRPSLRHIPARRGPLPREKDGARPGGNVHRGPRGPGGSRPAHPGSRFGSRDPVRCRLLQHGERGPVGLPPSLRRKHFSRQADRESPCGAKEDPGSRRSERGSVSSWWAAGPRPWN